MLLSFSHRRKNSTRSKNLLFARVIGKQINFHIFFWTSRRDRIHDNLFSCERKRQSSAKIRHQMTFFGSLIHKTIRWIRAGNLKLIRNTNKIRKNAGGLFGNKNQRSYNLVGLILGQSLVTDHPQRRARILLRWLAHNKAELEEDDLRESSMLMVAVCLIVTKRVCGWRRTPMMLHAVLFLNDKSPSRKNSF